MKIKEIKVNKDELKKAIVNRLVEEYLHKKRFSFLFGFQSKIDDEIKRQVLEEIRNNKKLRTKIKKLLRDENFVRESIQKAVVDYVMDNLRWGWEE